MLKLWEFRGLTAAASLVLVVANMLMFQHNRSLQAEVNQRQQYIQQSIQLEGLSREMVQALAELSVRNNDEQLKALLASQGITINVNPAPAESQQGQKAQ